ncbi:MAG: metallophosphoesterase, partial [Clostridia bacterium]|nr:metallophosphoesterase [Clostridia bacterium]
MKKIIAIILTLALLVTFVACKGDKDTSSSNNNNNSNNNNKKPTDNSSVVDTPKELTEEEKWLAKFDEKNIVFTFGAISDVHIDGAYMAGSSMNKNKKAFKVLKEKSTTGKLDAVVIAGDLVNCTNSIGNVFVDEKYPGTKEENQIKQSKAEREYFKKVVKESLSDSTALFYALGNHDSVSLSHTKDFIDDFSAGGTKARYFKYDVDMDLTAQGLRHCIIGGQHFFAIELSGGPYRQTTYDWLRSEFDKIIAKDPNTNIFLAAHYSPEYAKGYTPDGKDTFEGLLTEYPQVIVMSGHDHDYVQKETSIMQDEEGFVALNCGSACYFLLQNTTPGLNCVNANEGYIQQHHGGLLVEIDKIGIIRVRRLNFKTETICADDWMIPALKNGKRALKYTAARKEQVEKPKFKKDATLLLEQSKYNLRLAFDAATCEDYIYYYRVEIINNATGTEHSRFGVTSRFFADKDKT